MYITFSCFFFLNLFYIDRLLSLLFLSQYDFNLEK